MYRYFAYGSALSKRHIGEWAAEHGVDQERHRGRLDAPEPGGIPVVERPHHHVERGDARSQRPERRIVAKQAVYRKREMNPAVERIRSVEEPEQSVLVVERLQPHGKRRVLKRGRGGRRRRHGVGGYAIMDDRAPKPTAYQHTKRGGGVCGCPLRAADERLKKTRVVLRELQAATGEGANQPGVGAGPWTETGEIARCVRPEKGEKGAVAAESGGLIVACSSLRVSDVLVDRSGVDGIRVRFSGAEDQGSRPESGQGGDLLFEIFPPFCHNSYPPKVSYGIVVDSRTLHNAVQYYSPLLMTLPNGRGADRSREPAAVVRYGQEYAASDQDRYPTHRRYRNRNPNLAHRSPRR